VKAVLTALAASSFVTVLKFIAFFLSGSGAMLSEAIHSAADTGNQLLLFIGLKRGSRERDEEFHYSYGGERFVSGLLSAISALPWLGYLCALKTESGGCVALYRVHH
jgi:zinc transporter 9